MTTSPSRPEEGDTVTITPKPDEGFEVDEILVKDEDGNPVEVIQNPDGTYTFTQPDRDSDHHRDLPLRRRRAVPLRPSDRRE